MFWKVGKSSRKSNDRYFIIYLKTETNSITMRIIDKRISNNNDINLKQRIKAKNGGRLGIYGILRIGKKIKQ